LLTEYDLSPEGSPRKYVAWDAAAQRPLVYDPALRRYERDGAEPALFGEHEIGTQQGDVMCRPAFALCAELCRRYSSEAVEAICGVGREQIESAARLLWQSRPVAYYAWSGVEQQSNATQIFRTISMLYALTGSFDARGGNVLFPSVPAARSRVQLRRGVVEPRGEARSDTEIVFDLACRLGLGDRFWDGDIEAAHRDQLGPSGVTLDALRENPGGVRVPLQTRYRKYAEQEDGVPKGFATPTRKIELYCETFLAHGYRPLPEHEEPLVGPLSRPDL